MPTIELSTDIFSSTSEICFDLSRSIGLHIVSTAHTGEKAIAGKTSGLLELNECVTWQATHFGIRQKLTSKMTALEQPHYFKDEQVSGAFTSFAHEHFFEQIGNNVQMKDVFHFQSPYGMAGRLFNTLVLTAYMRSFLENRNKVIKEFAETDKWKQLLDEKLYLKH